MDTPESGSESRGSESRGSESQSTDAVAPRRRFFRIDLVRARRRFLLSVVVGLVAALSMHGFELSVRLIAGWDAGAAVMLITTWWIIMTSGPHKTRRRAATQDPGRTTLWAMTILFSVVSLFSAAGLLRTARQLPPAHAVLLTGLCLSAVVVSWLLTHSLFALRYAHLYYRLDEEGEGGLTFPGDAKPDDWDFAYFSFTMGMCFQTSDICITSRNIRRHVLLHAILSFAYNTVILALALNLAFGLLG